MNHTFYIAIALFAAGVLAANSAMAASSVQQSITQSGSSDGSTVIRQSSSQSSSSSNSLVVSNSSSRSVLSSSGNLEIDRELSGKIASSQFNLTSGEVEAVLFGDWELNSTGFAANFTRTPVNGTDSVEYEMGGLELNSIQEINDSLVMAGTIDVTSNGTEIEDAPITIMIQSGILVVGFDREADASGLFRIPIIGFAE